MLALIVSLLCRPFRAVARWLPTRGPTLAWAVEDGVSVAVWIASEADEDTGTVRSVHLAISSEEAPRQPFMLRVSPEGYMPATFHFGDLETARAFALRQLAVARRLPALGPAAGSFDAAAAYEPAPESGLFSPDTSGSAGQDKAA